MNMTFGQEDNSVPHTEENFEALFEKYSNLHGKKEGEVVKGTVTAVGKDGVTVGVTYGKGKDIWLGEDEVDIIIPCGLERGGGREMVLALACDAVISISGGSGTLTELAIAYQAGIPTIALTGYCGWSDKLANTFMDDREHGKTLGAKTPQEAVDLAFSEAEKFRAANSKK